MKLSIIVLFSLVSAALCYEAPLLYYHENVGIPEAARIKQVEEGVDFDGSRIVGGSAANLGQYPYLGGLIITLTTGAQSVCGSSLLSNTRLVTAAHCWFDGRHQGREVTVVLGSVRLFSGGTRINTRNVQMHGSWNPSTIANDVAVISINHVGFSNNINRISLATGSANYAGTWAQAAGFGLTADNAAITTNQVLSHVTLQVITNSDCRRTFGTRIRDSTICTSGANGRSTCRGDSGGPLSISSGGGRLLIGITSFGTASCQRGSPAAYARVTSFASWINSRL
ncbi:collagenase-like [Bombyx mandarina]|uniref:Collagenase-like n=1 Tax=Bombyx mandarina TaxID=7092 RepID=A0A6J2KE59_BOMMA|nr:collagenase-like [Bombyx mandarina]